MSHEPLHRSLRADSALHDLISDDCITTLSKLDKRLRSDRSMATLVILDCISAIVDCQSDQSIVLDTLLKLARKEICGRRALEALRELDQDLIVRAFLERRNHNPDFPVEYREILEQL